MCHLHYYAAEIKMFSLKKYSLCITHVYIYICVFVCIYILKKKHMKQCCSYPGDEPSVHTLIKLHELLSWMRMWAGVCRQRTPVNIPPQFPLQRFVLNTAPPPSSPVFGNLCIRRRRRRTAHHHHKQTVTTTGLLANEQRCNRRRVYL